MRAGLSVEQAAKMLHVLESAASSLEALRGGVSSEAPEQEKKCNAPIAKKS